MCNRIKGGGRVCSQWAESPDPIHFSCHLFDEICGPLYLPAPHLPALSIQKRLDSFRYYSHCLSPSTSIEMKWIPFHCGFLPKTTLGNRVTNLATSAWCFLIACFFFFKDFIQLYKMSSPSSALGCGCQPKFFFGKYKDLFASHLRCWRKNSFQVSNAQFPLCLWAWHHCSRSLIAIMTLGRFQNKPVAWVKKRQTCPPECTNHINLSIANLLHRAKAVKSTEQNQSM